MDSLELSHGNSFQRLIPIFWVDKDWNKSTLPIDEMSVTFSIHKNWKVEYVMELEKQDGKFYLELTEDDVNMFAPWDYSAKIKIKKWKETKTKSFPIKISAND